MHSWTLTPQAPRRRPTRAGIITLAAAVLAIGIAAYAVAYAQHRPRTATGAAPATASGHVTAPPNRVDLSDAHWRDFHGIGLPYSAANGPGETSGERAHGFADTAGGAVFAAVHIGVRANAQWGPGVFEPTIDHQIDGPDKTTLLDQTESAYEDLAGKSGVASGGPVGRAYAVEEAFRVESFSRDAATVDIVTAGPGDDGTTVRAATRIQLTWRDHDWRVLAPPGGDWGASAHTIDGLGGYRPFGDEEGGA